MDKNLIKKLINLGVVTLEINGKEIIVENFIQHNHRDIEINNGTYNSCNDNIVVKSINLKKLKSLLEVLESIISLSSDTEIDIIDFNQLRAMSILRNLDKSKNDFERLEYISSIIKEEKLFNGDTSFLSSNNMEEGDLEELVG